MKKTLWQIVKFSIVSSAVTILQIILVNVLFVLCRNLQAPLPNMLSKVFSEELVGVGNSNWGYVLPFFLSNVIANIYGWFQNRKTTFHSNASHRNIIIYFIVLAILILCSTWIQGMIVHQLTIHQLFVKYAPTIAALIAGILQFLVLFPLEKFVLLKEDEGE